MYLTIYKMFKSVRQVLETYIKGAPYCAGWKHQQLL